MLKDQRELLEALNAHGVEYLVIGGHAVSAYAEPRNTKDLDILIRDTPENALRTYRALAAFGAPVKDYHPSDFHGHPGRTIQFGVPPGRIDILQSIDGVSADDAWHQRNCQVLLGDTPVNLISLEHLILNKRAAGRLQDLADVEKLEQYNKKK
jgi:predicted nucleotidyltransferase